MSQEDITELPPALDEQGNVIPGAKLLTPEALSRMLAAVNPHLERMLPIYQQHPGANFALSNNLVGRDYYDKHFGVLSLTEAPDNLLMWAHYGDSHRGVVLGFDEQHPFFQGPEIVNGLGRINKVEYNQTRPVLSPTTRNHPKIFLRKSTEWAYEREWRLIRPLSEAIETEPRDAQVSICLFDLPHAAVTAVITGSQMSQSEYHEICAYCTATPTLSHIKFHHILLDSDHYKLEVHPALTEEEQARRINGKVMSAKPFEI